MPVTVPSSRLLLAGMLVVALAGTSGCSWFRKDNELYADDPASRPLEVPPPLPQAGEAQPTGSVTASEVVAARQATNPGLGFNAAGSRDEVFASVGSALEGIEGVSIASRAQLLGAYDVAYKGSNFLVRVSETQSGAYVSAVDPRGVAASGEGPAELIGLLRAAIAGN